MAFSSHDSPWDEESGGSPPPGSGMHHEGPEQGEGEYAPAAEVVCALIKAAMALRKAHPTVELSKRLRDAAEEFLLRNLQVFTP